MSTVCDASKIIVSLKGTTPDGWLEVRLIDRGVLSIVNLVVATSCVPLLSVALRVIFLPK